MIGHSGYIYSFCAYPQRFLPLDPSPPSQPPPSLHSPQTLTGQLLSFEHFFIHKPPAHYLLAQSDCLLSVLPKQHMSTLLDHTASLKPALKANFILCLLSTVRSNGFLADLSAEEFQRLAEKVSFQGLLLGEKLVMKGQQVRRMLLCAAVCVLLVGDGELDCSCACVNTMGDTVQLNFGSSSLHLPSLLHLYVW